MSETGPQSHAEEPGEHPEHPERQGSFLIPAELADKYNEVLKLETNLAYRESELREAGIDPNQHPAYLTYTGYVARAQEELMDALAPYLPPEVEGPQQ